MTSTTNRWKLGLFVVAAIALGVAALLWLGAARFGRPQFPAVTFFNESVQGLAVGSPVTFRGVTIGTVGEITIAPDGRHVEVTADVYLDTLVELGLRESTDVPDIEALREQGGFVEDGLRLQLVNAGITGQKYIQADFFDVADHPLPRYGFEVPPNHFPSVQSSLKSFEVVLFEAANRMPVLMRELTELTGSLDTLLSETDVAGMAESLQRLFETVDGKLGPIDTARLNERILALLEGAEESLGTAREVAHELREPVRALVHDLDATTAALREALDVAEVADTVAALRETADAVNALAHSARGLSDDMRRDLPTMRATADAVRALAELIERDPGVLLRGRGGEEERP